MPQPNMQQMLKQVQKMQADMARAQEELAAAEVEASAGGGMVTVRVSGALVVKEIRIDPAAIDPDDPELLVRHGARRGQRGAARGAGARGPEDGRRDRAASTSARSAASDCPAFERAYAPPIQRLVTELSKLPGIGNRTAQRLAFHILRAADADAAALAPAIREVKERIGLCEVCFNLAEGPRCRICEDERRDPAVICVVEEPPT